MSILANKFSSPASGNLFGGSPFEVTDRIPILAQLIPEIFDKLKYPKFILYVHNPPPFSSIIVEISKKNIKKIVQINKLVLKLSMKQIDRQSDQTSDHDQKE